MSRTKRFQKLLEPYHIGRVRTRNRMIKTAAGTNLWDAGEHRISRKALAFYEAVARGGVGLLVVESPILEDPFNEPGDLRYRLDDDRYIKDVRELTDRVHKYGCPAFVQFYHRGTWPQPYAPRRPRIAASAVNPNVVKSEFDLHDEGIPRALTVPEIKDFVNLFATFAERAQKAGFDGVEFNAAADHLFATFISRFWNKRHDEYGCDSMENRTRFLVEVIKETKKRTGHDFPILVTMNGVEVGGGPEGMTYDEGKELARMLQSVGANALQVRSVWFGNHVGSYNNENLFYPEPQVPLKSFPKELNWSEKGRVGGVNIPVAEAVKKAVSIPILVVGGFYPELGEKILRQGKADFIGFCRRLFADPELPNKVAAGRLDDIAPCTHCSTCQKMNLLPKECRVNAALGTEQYAIEPADKKKKVVVVGGGPAGMEAARVAALRGHEVTLLEKEHRLGGSLPMAALVKGTEIEDLPAMVGYLQRQIIKLGVKVRLGEEANPSMVEEIRPDVVIVATGGLPVTPDIPGIDRGNVVSTPDLRHSVKTYLRFLGPRFLRWLTRFWLPIGKNVIVIGGTIQACQIAEFLVKRGRKVTVVDSADTMGEGLVTERKNRLFWWFRKKGVVMISGVKCEVITDKGLTIIDKDGKRQVIAADSIVPTLPLAPNTGLSKSLEDKFPEVYSIGDCREPRLIPDAIADGWRIANKI